MHKELQNASIRILIEQTILKGSMLENLVFVRYLSGWVMFDCVLVFVGRHSTFILLSISLPLLSICESDLVGPQLSWD